MVDLNDPDLLPFLFCCGLACKGALIPESEYMPTQFFETINKMRTVKLVVAPIQLESQVRPATPSQGMRKELQQQTLLQSPNPGLQHTISSPHQGANQFVAGMGPSGGFGLNAPNPQQLQTRQNEQYGGVHPFQDQAPQFFTSPPQHTGLSPFDSELDAQVNQPRTFEPTQVQPPTRPQIFNLVTEMMQDMTPSDEEDIKELLEVN